jgi:hypothetical protein
MAATIWIAYSTKQLRDFADQQAGDMKTSLEMTRNAIFAANRQAAAAETANDQARESAKVQLRAYVVQTSIETQNIINGNLTSIFHMKNVGQTPAINLGFAVHSEVVAPTNNVVPSYEFSKARDPSVATEILGAGIDTSERIIRDRFSDEELDSVRKKKAMLIVWGVVWYDDIFGQPHSMRFCKSFKDADFARWNVCSSHNDAS